MDRPALLLLAVLALFLPVHAIGEDASVAAALDAYLGPLDRAGELSGVLLVARGDEVLRVRAFGRANVELDVPNQRDTRFNVASLTKPMTVIIALELIGSGVMAADDPVSRWLPDFPGGADITVRMLLQHRAGIAHRVTRPEEEASPLSTADMVTRIAAADRLFEPDTDEAYSSAGYTLLTRLMELASGKSFNQLLTAHVTEPAGATDTVHPEGHESIPGRATSYFRGAAGPINAPLKHLGFLAGAGSVFSTAEDLFRIQRRLLTGGYGEEAGRNLVRANGLRWNGLTNGYRAFADYHADGDTTIIWVSNYFVGAGDWLRRDLPRIVAGESVDLPVPPDIEAVAVSGTDRARLVGEYRLRPGLVQPLRFQGDIATLGDWVLIPVGADRFFSPQDYGEVIVERGPEGSVTALRWNPGPTFPRVADPSS